VKAEPKGVTEANFYFADNIGRPSETAKNTGGI
jgi:hypothetical protein